MKPEDPPLEIGPARDDDIVPVFGSWRNIYAAVVACALTIMGLVALFSSWKY